MMDRQKGKLFFQCDGCDEVLETNTGDFLAALKLVDDEGWAKRRNKAAEWEHFCPKCK